jgi:hypothetical protein
LWFIITNQTTRKEKEKEKNKIKNNPGEIFRTSRALLPYRRFNLRISLV